MIRKYHNHKLQTNPWHCEGEPHNNHETPGRQTRQSNQLSLPHLDDCRTRMDIKKRTTTNRTITYSHNGSNNKQINNNNRTTALERTASFTSSPWGQSFFWKYAAYSGHAALIYPYPGRLWGSAIGVWKDVWDIWTDCIIEHEPLRMSLRY